MKIKYQKELEKVKKIINGKTRGVTVKEISNKIGVNRNVVAKYLDVLQMAGDVDAEQYGRSKVYFTARSVPISTVFDYSNDFIVVVGKDMTTVEINTPFIKYFGLLKKDEIIGKHIKTLPLVNSYPKITADIKEALKNQEILKKEIRYKGKNNSTTDYFHAKFVPTALKDGEKGVAVILSKVMKK